MLVLRKFLFFKLITYVTYYNKLISFTHTQTPNNNYPTQFNMGKRGDKQNGRYTQSHSINLTNMLPQLACSVTYL